VARECVRGDRLSDDGHSLLHVTNETSIAGDNRWVVAVAVRVTAIAEGRRPRCRS